MIFEWEVDTALLCATLPFNLLFNILQEHPSGKYFENAPKFKSSPQNNGISAALIKQKLCGSGM
jgi:hypothetical protein